MDGVLNVHKPAGPTSHDIVYKVRRIFGQKKVGHAGTLDPLATGVLVVCLGAATRIVEYLMGTQKDYRARMVLGRSTDTQDSTGNVEAECDASGITRAVLECAVSTFVGRLQQVPPMVSAIKHEGRPLYKLAREGRSVERAPREITVHSIEVMGFQPGPRAEAEIVVRCSSGTYIRTLCADIGDKLGCRAHMSALERTRVGRFCIEDSLTIDELVEVNERGGAGSVLMSIDDALADLPSTVVREQDLMSVMHGCAVAAEGLRGDCDAVRMLSPDGRVIAIGRVTSSQEPVTVKPRKVFVTGEE